MKKQEVIKLLSEFIEIESVSSDSLRKKEMKKAVGFLKGLLTEIGCEVKILDGDAGPGRGRRPRAEHDAPERCGGRPRAL